MRLALMPPLLARAFGESCSWAASGGAKRFESYAAPRLLMSPIQRARRAGPDSPEDSSRIGQMSRRAPQTTARVRISVAP